MKKTWVSAYLSLAPDDEIEQTFAKMDKNGDKDFETLLQVDMPERYHPIEKFTCRVYSIQLRVT